MNDQAQALKHAVSKFKLSGSDDVTTTRPIKKSNRQITKISDRKPANKAIATNHAIESTPSRKVAAGGGDWESF